MPGAPPPPPQHTHPRRHGYKAVHGRWPGSCNRQAARYTQSGVHCVRFARGPFGGSTVRPPRNDYIRPTLQEVHWPQKIGWRALSATCGFIVPPMVALRRLNVRCHHQRLRTASGRASHEDARGSCERIVLRYNGHPAHGAAAVWRQVPVCTPNSIRMNGQLQCMQRYHGLVAYDSPDSRPDCGAATSDALVYCLVGRTRDHRDTMFLV